MIIQELKTDNMRPWLCKPEAIAALQLMAKEVPLNLFFDDPEPVEPVEPAIEEMSGKTEFQIINGVMVIPVCGMIVPKCSDLEKEILGLTSYEEINEQVSFAKESEQVKAVVFDFDSPGGTACNCFETATAIKELAELKPTIAFCSTQCDSAAYFLAAGAEIIYCSPSSEIGCVGSVMQFYDVSKSLEAEGVKVETFKTGEYKGISNEVPLTESQRKFLQHGIDIHGGMFKDFVLSQRPQIAIENLAGQDFVGIEAYELGFADSLANSIDVAIADALKMTT